MNAFEQNNGVVNRFRRMAERRSGELAIVARGQQYSYRGFASIAESVRRVLEASKLVGACRVGVLTSDGILPYAALLAILANGSTYVPINPKNPVSRNRAIIRDASISGLIVESSSVPASAAYGGLLDDLPDKIDVISVAPDECDECSVLGNYPRSHETPAYLLFTSGSTGRPKGVPITSSNLDSFIAVLVDSGLYDFDASDRFLQMFELTFDLSMMSFLVPLTMGASCHIVPDSAFGSATILKFLHEQKISVALMVPSLLIFLEQYLEKRIRLPDMRISLFCGEALPDSLVQKWSLAAPNSTIENVYGPTEATIFCLRYEWDPGISPQKAINGIVPIGRPLPGTGAFLVDSNGGRIEGTGEKGELCLTGAQLASGYWQDEEKTAMAFELTEDGERAYRTGDLCAVDNEGDFLYFGRLDSQVKVDGHRVELGEIEYHVRKTLGRSDIAVVVLVERGRNYLHLALEMPEIDFGELTRTLGTDLPEYMIPHHVEYVDRLPVNLSGKIDRPKLKEMLEETRMSKR